LLRIWNETTKEVVPKQEHTHSYQEYSAKRTTQQRIEIRVRQAKREHISTRANQAKRKEKQKYFPHNVRADRIIPTPSATI
jgi:hypothetical protein